MQLLCNLYLTRSTPIADVWKYTSFCRWEITCGMCSEGASFQSGLLLKTCEEELHPIMWLTTMGLGRERATESYAAPGMRRARKMAVVREGQDHAAAARCSPSVTNSR